MTFFIKKMHMKLFAKFQPFCSGLSEIFMKSTHNQNTQILINVLTILPNNNLENLPLHAKSVSSTEIPHHDSCDFT